VSGSTAGFADLVRRHQHFLEDWPLAEDITQEVFLQLYREQDAVARDRFDSDCHVRYWLRKVTSHRCIDAARKRKLRPRLNLEDIGEPVARDEFRDPMLGETLRKLVAALPETPRMVVLLRYQEEMEPAEIAETIGMPLATVKSHLHRSLTLLRGKMQRKKELVR
jgi:RNA polymerase sigma-70 factor (ECF subfamily)